MLLRGNGPSFLTCTCRTTTLSLHGEGQAISTEIKCKDRKELSSYWPSVAFTETRFQSMSKICVGRQRSYLVYHVHSFSCEAVCQGFLQLHLFVNISSTTFLQLHFFNYISSTTFLCQQGLVHITGGGFTDNIPRVMPKGLGCSIDKTAWEVPQLFKWMQEV
jgi:hypothetical protein